MLSAKSVIPECYIDSNLFDVLLNFEKESVNHTKGNSTLVTKMATKFKDLFCVGIIDKDKRDLAIVKIEYESVNVDGVENYFKLYKHKTRSHYLIQMVPEIETWICNVADELNINLTAEPFLINATTPRELALITKNTDKKGDHRFKALFKEMIKQATEQNFAPVLKLKEVINLILERNYHLEKNELENV